jgi:hypothetical protein
MALGTRPAPAVLFAAAFLIALFTRCPCVWGDPAHGTIVTARGAMALVDQADCALARALPVFFDRAGLDTRTLPAVASSRHLISLVQFSFHPTDRLDLHAGAGLAQIVDVPADSIDRRTGWAVGAGASYAVLRPEGFSLGLQLNAVRVSYGATGGFTDETMLVALTTR